jgi:phosphoribosylanthranilate isomerase
MSADPDSPRIMKNYHDAVAILLDTYIVGVARGTGLSFNRDIMPEGIEKSVILASSLNPSNVTEAIGKLRPYAVDVSGADEQDNGTKSSKKMKVFVHEVINAH